MNSKIKKPGGDNFPVIGIGASAGGLEAYKELLNAIPQDSPMAYILVQHLDRTHESMLPEILARHTALPVLQITDNIDLVPGHIYILPSNKLLLAVDGVLKLMPRPEKDSHNKPIDLFFSSLADVHKESAVGIVLSGTGTDGTKGLQAIKNAGGITFAQDPSSAAYDGMPQSAIDGKAVDFILLPQQMPLQLKQINFEPPFKSDQDIPSQDEETYRQILSLLRLRRLVDFSYYKQNTIKRRMARRMAISNIRSASEYLNFLKINTNELDILFEDLLIPVTAFFRDEKPFENLKDKVFPVITKDKSVTVPIRIWVAGCSTGEEVYSLAISLYEFLGDNTSRLKIQIFGTDISEKSIVTARAGIYSQKQVEVFSTSRLQQFFTRLDGSFQVSKFIRDMCVFASHNFLKDPPFARLDLISCRNVLIYMEAYLQKKALSTFHYSLNEKGYLLLGKSETTGSAAELFALADKHEKIYLKKNVLRSFIQNVSTLRPRNVREEKVFQKSDHVMPDFQKTADEILLQEYTPAGVVINDQSDIVHFRGDTGSYLTSSPGKPTLNLFKMARQGLSFELRNALHKAKIDNKTVSKEAIPVQYSSRQILVNIKIIPLPKTIEPHYLVLFQDTQALKETVKQKSFSRKNIQVTKDEKDLHIIQLENELSQTREDMKGITEEQEAANEELQSANEELLSSQEELQSLNEELETTKEELQSANEELTIFNHELVERNTIISDSYKYSDAIIGTIRGPLIVLNKDLMIRSANKSFYKTFQVSEDETEGKLLYEIGNKQWDIKELRTLLQNIFDHTTVTDFEVCQDFPEMGQRTMLLNASLIKREADKEQLILLSIEDITERKRMQDQLRQMNDDLEQKIKERTVLLEDANNNLAQSNKDLMQFAHVASHDLKEPLRKITTFSNRLKEDEETSLSEKGIVYLQKIQKGSDRMSDMIDGVLSYSSMNASHNVVESIDLNKIIKSIEDDLELLIQQKDATIQYNRLPQIEGAEVLIYQLFYNLINNSLKFSLEGREQVIFISSVSFNQHGSDFAKITIKDRGIGFETEEAEVIFESFTRLHPKEKFEGTGLGLTLCKKIAERHGGTIVAKGTKNEGAEFIVLLPLKQHVDHI